MAVEPGAAPLRAAARLAVAAWPAAALLFLAMLLQWTGADHAVASVLQEGAGGRWLLGSWTPLSKLLYQGERTLIYAVVLGLLGVIAASFRLPAFRQWRRPATFVLACFVVTTGLASFGKHVSNVDCPHALSDYGGSRPYVSLLGRRPADLPRAQCFPGGHSSAAFSFVSLYFLPGALPRRRRLGLAAALGLGFAFAFTQWARGMHFPSHDVTSLAIAWAVAAAASALFDRDRGPAGHAPAAG